MFISASSAVISSNTITGNYYGEYVEYLGTSTQGNTIEYNTYGIYGYKMVNGYITLNSILNNTYGVYLENSTGVDISGNNRSFDDETNNYGIYLNATESYVAFSSFLLENVPVE